MANQVQVAQADLSKELYSMALGDIVVSDEHYVIRVPGGWVWAILVSGRIEPVAATFVPFSDEFKAKPRPGVGGMIPGI